MDARSWLLLLSLGMSCDSTATYAEYCDHVCACTSCTSEELSACKKFGSELEKGARDQGCADELAELMGCIVANLHCDGGTLDLADNDVCKDEDDAAPIGCNPFR